MPSKKKVVKVYLDDDEYEVIQNKAQQTRESMSSYLRRVGLELKVTARTDAQAAALLFKANADLGRLGGLFKLAITDGYLRHEHDKFRILLHNIDKAKTVVASHCHDVAQSLKGGRD